MNAIASIIGVVSILAGLYLLTKSLFKKKIRPEITLFLNNFLVVVTGVVMVGSVLNYFRIPFGLNNSVSVSAAADPQVSLSVPSTLIGDTFDVTTTFSNGSTVDTGFGPYVDLIIPFNGTDGVDGDTAAGSSTEADGIVSVNSATYLGSALTLIELVFPNDTGIAGQNTGCVEHPFAVDASAVPIEVCGDTGDILVVAQLPFGSFVPDQPDATVTFNVTMSEKADISQPLEFQAKGGFAFGNDEFANPNSDPSIIATTYTAATTNPQVVVFDKSFTLPEAETATGPNYPFTYTLTASLAVGQTVDDFTLVDELPNNLVFKSLVSATPGCLIEAPVPPTTGPANGSIVTVNCGTINPPTDTITATYEVYVSDQDADGSDVINHGSCDDTPTINSAYSTGDWDPVDDRDKAPIDPSANNSFVTPIDSETITNKCIQIQKSNSIAINAGDGSYTPGDILAYTLDFQISDYYALQDIDIQDIVQDGIHLLEPGDANFQPPTLSITSGTTNTTGPIDSANYTITNNWTGATPPPASPDGTTILDINVSNELINRGLSDALFGGCVSPDASVAVDCDGPNPVYNVGSTTGSITYYGIILDQFTDSAGDSSVDHNDVINNSVTIEGEVIDNADRVSLTGSAEADGSGSSVRITTGALEKNILAINGADPAGINSLSPGDEVTYQVSYTLPSSDTESLLLQDYLPKPVYDVNSLTAFFPTSGGIVQKATTSPYSVPPIGEMWLGPNDTFYGISGIIPNVTTNSGGNSFDVVYGTFDDPLNQISVADIVFTVAVSDAPFADGLKLTNQALATEQNTNGAPTTSTEINQITLDEPHLTITKGAIDSDSDNETFNPDPAYSGVTFSPAGTSTACGHFTGPISTNIIDGNPIISDIENVDGSDVIRFATIIENIGHNQAYDVFVRDELPNGFSVPASGDNLCVTRGDGTVLATSNIGGGSGMFDQGIEIIDPVEGSILATDPTSGENIIVVTYDIQANADLDLQEDVFNHAAIFHYASMEGGTDFGGPGDGDIVFDDADIFPENTVEINKSPRRIEEPSIDVSQITIGSLVQYEIELTINEGVTRDVVVTDNLGAGLALVSIDEINTSPEITSSIAGGYPSIISNANITGQGSNIVLDFGDIINIQDDNSVDETITIVYTAVVLNDGAVSNGDPVNNTAIVEWSNLDEDGNPETLSNIDNDNRIEVVEPNLEVTKNIVETSGDAGDTLTIELSVDHTATSSANGYDLSITDMLPTGMTFASGFTTVSGVAPTTATEAGGIITLTYNSLALAEDSTVSFTVSLDGSVAPGGALLNEADLEYTSMPGDGSTAESPYNRESTEQTYTGTGEDTLVVDNYTITKAVIDTAINDNDVDGGSITTGNNVVVGEEVQYEVVVTIPEGEGTNVRLRDFLDDGLDFVSIDSITASPGVSTSVSGGYQGVITNTTFSDVRGGRRRANLNFGTLTNTNNDDTIEQITIRYTVVVENASAITEGAQRNNRAQWLQNSPVETIATSGPELTVQEPRLTATKVSDIETINSGDTIEYTIEVTNNGSAPALDVVVDDQVPAEFSYINSSASITTTHTASTDDTNAPDLLFSIDQIDVGETVTINYQMLALNTVVAGKTYTNEAEIQWTSLNGTNSGERTGDESDPGSTENDYTTTVTDDVVIESLVPSKSIISSSEVDTVAGADGVERVVIGEVVRYRLVNEISESSLPNFAIVDDIPEGMQFIDDGTATVILISNDDGVTNLTSDSLGTGAEALGSTITNATFGIPGSVVSNVSNPGNPFGSGDDVRFDLGNVVNADNDTDSEYIIIELNALVLNDITNQGGTTLENSFESFIDDGSGEFGFGETAIDASNSVIIAEPNVSISKSIITSPTDAGDPVVYEIRLENGTGPNISSAYDLMVEDQLNNNLILQSVSVAGPANSDNSDISSNLVSIDVDALAPGEVVIITVNAIVGPNIENGETIANEGTYVYDSISEGAQSGSNLTGSAISGAEGEGEGARNGDDGVGSGLNNYAGTSDVDVTIGVPEIEKLSPTQTEYAIGEEVVYEILATLPEGDTVDLAIVDQIPDGLQYISYNIYELAADSTNLLSNYNGTLAAPSTSGGSGSGDNISFNFGTTNTVDDNDPDNNSFVIEVTVQVVNEADNQNGTELINEATIEWTNPDTGETDSISDEASPVSIIEPVLNITKSVDDASPTFGQTLEYTLFIEHDGTSTANAYNVDITDIIDSNLTYQAGSASLPLGWSVDESSDTRIIFSGDLPLNTTATITFDVVTASVGSIDSGSVVPNVANMSWTSLSGDNTEERDGSDGEGGLNNYTNSDFEDITITSPDLSISINDSIGSTNPLDTNIYDVQVNNLGNAQSDNVIVTIEIPAGTSFDSANSEVGWVCTPNNSAGSICTINLGTVDIAGQENVDFALIVNDEFPSGIDDIEVIATVADDGQNGPESDTTNNINNDIDVLDAAPNLSITKDDGTANVAPGDQTTYTLTITNSGTQNATGVAVTDTLPTTGVTYNSSSDSGSENSGVVSWPTFDLAVRDTVTRTVTIEIDDPVVAGISEIENFAEVEDDGTNGADLDPADNSDNDIDDVVAAPDLTISKEINSPAVITNGSVVEYSINYSNIGNQNSTGVVLTESVPIGSTFDPANPLNSGWVCAGITEGSVCTFDLAGLDVGISGSTTFVVIMDDPIDFDQETVDNTITIGDDGTNGIDTNLDNNDSTDSTPIDASPDLRTIKDDNQEVANAGQTITYIIEVFNDGNQDVIDATLVDTLPAGVTFVSASGGGIEAGGVVTWPAYDLNAGAGILFTVTITLDNPVAAGLDSITNTATSSFSPNSGDVDPTDNNTAEDTDTINAAPDLAVTKTDNGLSLVPGSTFAYDINYTNVGTQDATGVFLTDTIPTSTVFNSAASTPGWVCLPDNNPGSLCTFPIGDLDSGDSGSVVFAVTVDNPLGSGIDSTTNTVTIADDGTNGADENLDNNEYDEDTTVDALPELYIEKDDGGVTVEAGEVITYTLTYGNSGNQTSTGNVLTEIVPVGATIDLTDPVNTGWLCSGTTEGSTCTYNVGIINSGEEFTTTFAVIVNNPVASGIDTIDNSARIDDDGVNGAESHTDNNDDAAQTELNAAPDITVTKDNGISEVFPGDSYTYTITINNVGTQDATGVAITDVLPPELIYVGSSDSGTEAGGTVTWPLVDIAVGDTVTRTVDVLFDVPADQVPASLETLTNTVSAFDDGANGPDLDGSNNIDEDIDDVNGDVDLVVTIDDGNTTVEVGDTVVYKITVNNNGSQFASNTVVSVTIPEGVRYDPSSSIPGWTCTPDGNSGSVCILNVGTVTTIDETCVYFAVIVDDPSSVDEIDMQVNVEDDGTSGPELDDTNNNDNDVDNIIGEPNLTVSKTDNQNIAVPGETLLYEVEVTNNGNIILTGIEVIDTIPQYTTYVSSDNNGNFDSSLGVVNWSGLTLLPNESITLIVEVLVDSSVPSGITDLTNLVSASDDGAHGDETDPTDNEFEDVDELDARPELDVVIEATTELAYPGEEVEFLITHTNLGDQDATGVEVTFTIPENTTGQATSAPSAPTSLSPLGFNIGWVCPDLNAGTICTYLIGDVAAGEDCIIPFFVVLDEDLDPSNTTIIGETTVYDDGANGPEVTLVNNESSDNIRIPFVDIAVEKIALSQNANFGEQIEFEINFVNNGPDEATEVIIFDNLPLELTYVSSTLNGLAADPVVTPNQDGSSNVTYNVGNLAVNESGSIILVAEVTQNQDTAIVNRVSVATREAEILAINNENRTELIELYEITENTSIGSLLRSGGKKVATFWSQISMLVFGLIAISGIFVEKNKRV